MTTVSTARPLSLTLAALGGQGGGVITDWLVETARAAGFWVQATSVPGVAQRTGATIYYLEFLQRDPARLAAQPVMALMPSPGDVDIVVASELVEAGRALQRGFVTPDRTLVIASTHRDLTISEKSALDDGRTDSATVLTEVRRRAKRLVAFDMAQVAEASGGRISAVVLGAIAGAECLPFDLKHYRSAIIKTGIATDSNLRTFDAACQAARTAQSGLAAPENAPPERSLEELCALGEERLLDYQDSAYVDLYRQRLKSLVEHSGSAHGALHRAVARQLAVWMSFEDTFRVADLKTRGDRAARIRQQVSVQDGQLLEVSEFLKPRVDEMAGSLPAPLGRAILRSKRLSAWLTHWTEGRRIHTSRVLGFAVLRLLAAARRWRRGTLRYHIENERIEGWLRQLTDLAKRDSVLALEFAESASLVRGYGDTHARGWASFSVLDQAASQLVGTPDAALRLRGLRQAALADDSGAALAAALSKL